MRGDGFGGGHGAHELSFAIAIPGSARHAATVTPTTRRFTARMLRADRRLRAGAGHPRHTLPIRKPLDRAEFRRVRAPPFSAIARREIERHRTARDAHI